MVAKHLSQIDPECRLALAYVRPRHRDAVGALFALDAALAMVIAGGGQPLTRQLKLAWWRDALGRLDHAPPPPEPVLQQVVVDVLPFGIPGAELGAMTEGWEHLLGDGLLSPSDMKAYAQLRGGLLFEFAARILAENPTPAVARAGEAWALADLARRSRAAGDIAAALSAVRERTDAHARLPIPLRPLGMLAMLAARDAERGPGRIETRGAPRRMLAMLRYRLIGR